MRRLLSVRQLLAVLLLFGCDAGPRAEAPVATLAIAGVTLIDGLGGPARADMTVLLDRDRISRVGRSLDLRLPDGVPMIDGGGRFLIPGLWDMHVHLANEPDPPIAPEQQLSLFLAHGVVGVRDMGSDWKQIETLRARVASGEIPGPQIVSPGPFLDGPQPEGPAVLGVDGADQARAAVRSLDQRGVDFLKTQATLSRAAYLAAVGEANRLGLPVHGHVPDAMSAVEVSRAGQRTIEHVSPALPSDAAIFLSCSAREDELRRELEAVAAARSAEGANREEIAERTRALKRALIESWDADKAAAVFATLTEHGTRVVPTLIWSRTFSPPAAELAPDLPLEVMPRAMRDQWRTIWSGYFSRATPQDLDLNRQLAEGSLALVGALDAAGVGILAGTDSTFGFVLPGFSLHQELELLVAAGLSPGKALVAATRDAADLLGELDRRGTIEPGKRADLVLLEADPLADVRNTRTIAAVVAGGKVYSREDLDRVLAEAVEAGSAAPGS